MSLHDSLLVSDERLDAAADEIAQAPLASLARLLATMLAGAAVSGIAVYVGSRWLTMLWNFDLGFVPVLAGRVDPLRATLFAMLAGPLLLAAAFTLVAPFFGGPRRPLAALAVAVHGMMPVYIVGALMFFAPAVMLMLLAFFVGCLRWGRGAQRLLGVPAGEKAEFIALALLAASVALQIASSLAADLL
ncbi:MAG: hypothetical protein ACM3PU_12160 [Gemmatimonadota bacterium]